MQMVYVRGPFSQEVYFCLLKNIEQWNESTKKERKRNERNKLENIKKLLNNKELMQTTLVNNGKWQRFLSK